MPRPFWPRPGSNVTVIDRTGICEETSSGNAAAFAFSDVLPLAHKGMMRNLPKWLMDPLGPLSIPPAYLPKLLPWLVRFWRAGNPKHYEASLAAQASLMKLAEAEWMGLMDRSGTRGMLREDGSLELYDSEAVVQGVASRLDRPGQASASTYRHVDRADWPTCSQAFRRASSHGTFLPGWKTVADPKLLGKAIWAHAQAKGARFIQGDVGLAMPSNGRIAIQLKQGRTIMANRLVIAAGAWSHLLARQFGDRIPLETERGYNTTLPKSAFDLKRHADLFRPWLRRHAARNRNARRRRRRTRRALDRPPNFDAVEARCWRRPSCSCRASTPAAAANGWATGRRCRTRLPVIGAVRQPPQCVPTPSATAISA